MMVQHSRLLTAGKLKWYLLSVFALIALVMAIPALATAAPATIGTFTTSSATTYSNSQSYNGASTYYYKVVVSVPGSITFKGSATGTYAFGFDYAILDSSGVKIVGDPYYYNTLSNNSVTYSDSGKVYLNAGTYYFQIGYDTSSWTSTPAAVNYSYTMNLTYASAAESFPEPYAGNNNSFSTAKTIAMRTTYRGMFPTGALAAGGGTDNQDVYKFTLPYPSQQITIKTGCSAMGSGSYDYGSLKVTLYNSKGAVVYSRYMYPASNNYDTWVLSTDNGYLSKTLAAGTYYVGYKAAYDICVGGVYNVNVNPLPYMPHISRANGNGYTQVKWTKVTGVSGYYLYRKVPGGSFSKIYTAKSYATTSYNDKSVKGGQTYYYAVRAYYGSTLSGPSYYYTLNRYLSVPKLGSATRYESNYPYVLISWGIVTCAQRYYVYRKTTGGWTNLGYRTTTSGVDYTAKKGVKYTYTVRAWYQTGNWAACMSTYNATGVSFKP